MTGDTPIYESGPEQYREYLAEGNRTQPRKRVVADVLIRDVSGNVLLVDPKYKPDWDIPGGMVEANEPPMEAARREIREELGLTISVGSLLVVDWVPPHDPWDDSLAFVFDGGAIGVRDQESICLRDDEIARFGLFSPDRASGLLRPYVWRRLESALDSLSSDRTIYLHHGHRITV